MKFLYIKINFNSYDKANQLVSSETEGHVKKYVYDAAGRLVKEGNKSYTYAWLDKLVSVTEAGKVSANFDYHPDGQIASVTYADGRRENYLWDGLALIHRNGTDILNEPAITGGNPVLSGDKVLFNDLLGNTLGVKDQSSYQPIRMTAFGESDNADAFFTGKPLVGELGYAFLFCNYRPEQGKWQTSDPLGYPDGWNNFAYVNNSVTMAIDWLGAVLRGVHGRTLAGVAGILPYQHSWTSITLTPEEYESLDDKFKTGDYSNAWTAEDDGNMTTKLSAYEKNGKLVKQMNKPEDTNSQGLDFYDDITMTDVENILNNYDAYNNTADYRPTNQNCNTFTNTINEGNFPASMADTNTLQLFIGIYYTLDRRYFE